MEYPEQSLITHANQFVSRLFETKLDERFSYHTIQHTREVVQNAEMLADFYKLPEEQKRPLLLAAWFHDSGYTETGPRPHEEISNDIAVEFLKQRNVEPELIQAVTGCIMATRIPQSPHTLIEQILCDADLLHLGNGSFDEKNKLLRHELNAFRKQPLNKKEWRNFNIEFLKQHQFFTSYGKDVLEPVKQKHLEELLAKQEKSKKKNAGPDDAIRPHEEKSMPITKPENTEELINPEKEKEKKEEKNEKVKRTERGVVAMFRIMSENHINLSQMADSKANIMISVNTIVISILISVLLGKLQFYPEYIIPAIILVGICLAAVVFAILATRPNISGGMFTREDIQNKKVNLLFFGNFYKMHLEDYDWAMKEMMRDEEYLYGSMIKDMYFLGIVLARKYKFLRISYNIFMYGLIIAIVAFVIAFALSGTTSGS